MYYNQKEVGYRIQKLRVEKKITQEAMAENLGICAEHLGRIERGTKSVSLDLLIDISKFFAVSSDNILFGERTKVDEICGTIDSVIEQLNNMKKAI